MSCVSTLSRLIEGTMSHLSISEKRKMVFDSERSPIFGYKSIDHLRQRLSRNHFDNLPSLAKRREPKNSIMGTPQDGENKI